VAILSSSWGSSRLLCIEIPAALRHFQVVGTPNSILLAIPASGTHTRRSA